MCDGLLLRLDLHESQEKLQDLLKECSDGLGVCRKHMMSAGLDWGQVGAVLQSAGPYVMSFKKHTRTAKNLLSGCS